MNGLGPRGVAGSIRLVALFAFAAALGCGEPGRGPRTVRGTVLLEGRPREDAVVYAFQRTREELDLRTTGVFVGLASLGVDSVETAADGSYALRVEDAPWTEVVAWDDARFAVATARVRAEESASRRVGDLDLELVPGPRPLDAPDPHAPGSLDVVLDVDLSAFDPPPYNGQVQLYEAAWPHASVWEDTLRLDGDRRVRITDVPVGRFVSNAVARNSAHRELSMRRVVVVGEGILSWARQGRLPETLALVEPAEGDVKELVVRARPLSDGDE